MKNVAIKFGTAVGAIVAIGLSLCSLWICSLPGTATAQGAAGTNSSTKIDDDIATISQTLADNLCRDVSCGPMTGALVSSGTTKGMSAKIVKVKWRMLSSDLGGQAMCSMVHYVYEPGFSSYIEIIFGVSYGATDCDGSQTAWSGSGSFAEKARSHGFVGSIPGERKPAVANVQKLEGALGLKFGMTRAQAEKVIACPKQNTEKAPSNGDITTFRCNGFSYGGDKFHHATFMFKAGSLAAISFQLQGNDGKKNSGFVQRLMDKFGSPEELPVSNNPSHTSFMFPNRQVMFETCPTNEVWVYYSSEFS